MKIRRYVLMQVLQKQLTMMMKITKIQRPLETNLPKIKYSSFFGNHDLELKPEETSACHTLKSRNGNQTKDIIIVNKKIKVILLKYSKKLQGTKVFINEYLTAKNGETVKGRQGHCPKTDHRYMHGSGMKQFT